MNNGDDDAIDGLERRICAGRSARRPLEDADLRAFALELAFEARSPNEKTDDTVARAQAFHAFLKGENSPGAVRQLRSIAAERGMNAG